MIWTRIKLIGSALLFGAIAVGFGVLWFMLQAQKKDNAALKKQRDVALEKAANAISQIKVTKSATEAKAKVQEQFNQAPPPDHENHDDFDTRH